MASEAIGHPFGSGESEHPSRKALADVLGTDMAAAVWDRFPVHFTPPHRSWLNQAEIEIGIFSRQCLGKRRMNRDRIKIGWKFDRKVCPSEVWLQQQIFQAVTDLVAEMKRTRKLLSCTLGEGADELVTSTGIRRPSPKIAVGSSHF